MNRAYVTFLAVAAIFALILCVNYVQMQSRITSHSKEVSSLQKELADLKEQNNTKYNSVMDSVNLDEIREKAMNECFWRSLPCLPDTWEYVPSPA